MITLRNFLYLDSDLLDSYFAACETDLLEYVREEDRKTELMSIVRLISKSFSDDELKTLSLDVGEDYENLSGETKDGKARELVLLMDRKGRLEVLMSACRRERPLSNWSADQAPVVQQQNTSNLSAKFQRLYSILLNSNTLTRINLMDSGTWSQLEVNNVVEVNVAASLTKLAILSTIGMDYLALVDMLSNYGVDSNIGKTDRNSFEGIEQVRKLQEQAGVPIKMANGKYQMLSYLKQEFIKVQNYQLSGEVTALGKITKKVNNRRQTIEIFDPLGSPLGDLTSSNQKSINPEQQQQLLKSKMSSPTREVMHGPAMVLDVLAIYK